MTQISTIYRKDIDGLRALAVLSVMIFHFFPSFLPGGFLGVDIFFVVSGFLITGILYDQRKAGTFTYRGFYERRIRRLLPALFATLALSTVVAFLLFDGEELRDFGGSLFAAIFGVSNFFFYFEADYFGVQASSRPLLHTWTLAVEEQFYLLWPLLLWGLVKLPVMARIFLVLMLIAASTAIGEYQLRGDAAAAFYLLPARVGELAMGGLAAVLIREYKSVENFGQKTVFVLPLCVASLVFLFFAFFNYDGESFPGILAIPPAIATACLLVFPIKGRFSILLTNPLIRWIGLISYSAYLIHWPVLVFYETWQLRSITPIEGVVLIALTLGAASLFYLYIEQPFRYRHGATKKVSNRTMGGAVLASILALSTVAITAWTSQENKNEMSAISGYSLQEIDANRKAAFAERMTLVDVKNCHQFSHERDTDFSQCLVLEPGKDNILVFGSSFAAGDGLMMKSAYPDANIQTLTVQGCLLTRRRTAKAHCPPVYDFIEQNFDAISKFDMVVISSNWLEIFRPELLRPFIDKVTAPTVILGPRGKLNANSMQVLERLAGEGNDYASEEFLDKDELIMRERLSHFSSENDLVYIDMFSIFWENGDLPLHIGKGQLIFHDYGHYTPAGAEYVARKFKALYPTPEHILSGEYPEKNEIEQEGKVTGGSTRGAERKPVLSQLLTLKKRAREKRLEMVSADGCHQLAPSRESEFDQCLEIYDDKDNVLIVGNSYGAGDWLMLRSAYPEANIRKITAQRCTPTHRFKAEHCQIVYEFLTSNYERINRFDVVIISQNWDGEYDEARLETEFSEFIEAVNAPIVVFGPRGKLSFSVNQIYRRNKDNSDLKLDDSYTDPTDLDNRDIVQSYAAQNGLVYVDKYDILREDGGLALLVTDSQFVFLDRGHYSPAGADYVAQKFREIYPEVMDIIKLD